MYTLPALLLVGSVALFAGGVAGGDFVVMCYFTTWSMGRAGVGGFQPYDIDTGLCTHILYAFAHVHPTALTVTHDHVYDAEGKMAQVNAQKAYNRDLKVVLALGGAGVTNDGFSKAVSSDADRRLFASNVVSYLRQYSFDGVDIDWEKPEPYQKANYTLFLAALRSAFEEDAELTGKSRLLLTAALWSYKPVVEAIYEVDKIHQYLDLGAVMAYDYHGTWDATLGHNSALYTPDYEMGGSGYLSQNGTMFWWEALGFPREKLVMGLATYGRSFVMQAANMSRPGQTYDNHTPGNAGPHTQQKGTLAYYEVCQLLQSGFTSVFTEDSKVPYAYGPRDGHWEWVSYDNVQSMHTKANYIVNTGLGGAMFWSLDQDDFRNDICGQGPYPLISTVSGTLRDAIRTSTTTTTTTTAAPPAKTTATTSTVAPATTTATTTLAPAATTVPRTLAPTTKTVPTTLPPTTKTVPTTLPPTTKTVPTTMSSTIETTADATTATSKDAGTTMEDPGREMSTTTTSTTPTTPTTPTTTMGTAAALAPSTRSLEPKSNPLDSGSTVNLLSWTLVTVAMVIVKVVPV